MQACSRELSGPPNSPAWLPLAVAADRSRDPHVNDVGQFQTAGRTVPALDQACTKSAGALLDWLWLGFFTWLLSLQSCPLPELQMSS